MGLFLQAAVLPGTAEEAARAAVELAAGQPGYELTPELCRYVSCDRGTQILFGDGTPGFSALAEALSRGLQGPVLLLFARGGDHWGYDFYQLGRELDRFDMAPDRCRAITEQQRQGGSPEALARYFPIHPGDIRDYLTFCTAEGFARGEGQAHPGDRLPQGDCRQMKGFLARLGWPWPFDEGGEAQREPPLPTLAEILDKNLPPLADPLGSQGSYDFRLDDTFAPSSRVFATGNLPSALDPDYIRRLLWEDGRPEIQALAGMTPREVIGERDKAKAAIKYPSLYHIDPKLAAVSAFCGYWLGSAEGAFWDLYEALYSDPDNIYLHRARGLRAALGVKRHIAVKDMTALLELDPENREVYLLCRAFFHEINRKPLQARADLEELASIGFPAAEDPRINYGGFPRSFLAMIDRKRREGQ